MWNVTNIALDRSIASSLSHKTYSGQAALTISAIGVVLGNIGTSPLYAVDQIFYGPAHLAPTPDNVLGCISLAIWALTLIVSLKCAVFILRADNDGEGGVFALYSLLHNYREQAAYLPLLLAGLMRRYRHNEGFGRSINFVGSLLNEAEPTELCSASWT